MWVLEPVLDALRWYETRSGDLGELALEGALSLRDIPGLAQSEEPLAFVLAHGAGEFRQPVMPLNEETLERLERCIPFFPGYNALCYLLASESLQVYPHRGAYLFCETAFFSNLPVEAALFGLPYDYYEKGVRRYGADGLAHAWAWRRAKARHPALEKLVSVHLGSQPSTAAILNGAARETSAGFSAVAGIPGQFNCGDLDPGIPLKLLRSGWDADSLSFLVTSQAGFQMVSGVNGTLIELLEAEPRGLTAAMLSASLLKETGKCLAALEGAEMILFFGEEIERWETLIAEIKARLGFCSTCEVQTLDGSRMEILREVERWITGS